MKTNSLQQFVRLRRELTHERESLHARLSQINDALGEMPLLSLSSIQGVTGQSGSGRGAGATVASALGARRRGKRTMSPQARARIAAAQRARWAKQRGGGDDTAAKAGGKPVGAKPKRKMSAAARKAIAEAARKRWAAAKAAGK